MEYLDTPGVHQKEKTCQGNIVQIGCPDQRRPVTVRGLSEYLDILGAHQKDKTFLTCIVQIHCFALTIRIRASNQFEYPDIPDILWKGIFEPIPVEHECFLIRQLFSNR